MTSYNIPLVWTDTKPVEDEINSKYAHNPDFNINDIEIFVEITKYSYIPLETTVNDDGEIKIKNYINPAGLDLFVGSKHQFIHRRIHIEETTYKIELDEAFKTAWNKKKFIIFQNGYLMNSGLFTYIIPTFDNNYLKKVIYSTAPFNKNSRIDIYYIEANEDFDKLPISRDVYLGALKYTATKNNERLIKIPYPHKRYKSNSFFIFNENGEYLDANIDYVVSYDKQYITLKNPLKLATVDYIIFAFPQLSKEGPLEIDDGTDEPENILTGSPYFSYSYSVQSDYNETGLVRFYPKFDEYYLTKKNFILFGNGQWIEPNRFEIHSNDSIIFNNDDDKEACSSINYTMVIFDDNTDHNKHQLPRDYIIIPMKSKKENQMEFDIEANIDKRYKSFILFKDNYIMSNYEYDDELERIYFKEPVEGEFYCIFFSSIVNNTKQEALVYSTSFPCFKYGSYGTKIPDEYIESIDPDTTLLFLNGAFLEPSMYEIRDNRIYLDESFYKDDKGNPIPLNGYVFSMLTLVGAVNRDQVMVKEEEIEAANELQTNLEYNYKDSAYLFNREGIHSDEKGVIKFNDKFDRYKLTKRNILIYTNGGMWLDPSRYELINNNAIFLIYPFDQDRSPYTTYNMIVFDDLNTDEKYNPPNILLKQVIATEDNQNIFEIPSVHRRFRSFLLYKGGLLLNKEFNYDIIDGKIYLLHNIDYLSKGRSLTFIFLDAYSRQDQENLFIQSSFECKVNQITEIPTNFLNSRFNKNHIALYLNGLYLSRDKYEIDDNRIMLDGFIELEELNNHRFTILYLTTIPTFLKEYDYIIPSESDVPIKPNDIIPYATWQYSYSYNNIGRIIQFNPKFSDYSLTKENFLLFGNKEWIHPTKYELYNNNMIILNERNTDSIYKEYTMSIIDDSITNRDIGNAPICTKVIDVVVDKDNVKIPIVEEHYRTFIVFYKNKIVDLSKYKMDDEYIYLNEEYKEKGEHIWSFVFLHATMNIHQQVLLYQDSFKYEGDNTKIRNSIYDKDTSIMYSLYFVNGEYYNKFKYTINDGMITIPNVEKNSIITVVYLITIVDEDYTKEITVIRPEEGVVDGFRFTYSYSDEIVDKENNGIVSFSPRFTEYSLDINNFMLFSNGTWISPERYKRLTSNMIQFRDSKDISKSPWTHYTMVIPNEGKVDEDKYNPVSLTVYAVMANVDKQRIFNLPYKMKKGSTYLVFLGSLFLPVDETRIYINDNDQLIFLEENDYVDKGRKLYFVVLNDSSKNDRRFPMFVQETFNASLDPSRGTLIPSDIRDYENQMMLFLGSTYLDQSRYEIRDHMIYLIGDFEEMDNPYSTGFIKKRSYTAVYLVSKINEDYEEIIEPIIVPEEKPKKKERVLPEDDELDYSGYYFDIYSSDLETTNEYVEYLGSFNSFDLDKSNFLLFANSAWINPIRFNIIDNHTIEMKDNIDKAHSKYAHYNMIIPFNKTAYNIYQKYYAKPEFKIIETVTTEDTKELDLPLMDSVYESLLIFRNSLILPIYEEDRFYIDDINHKFIIYNKEDYIPKGTTVSFIFFKSVTNTDQKVLLIQESFKCLGLETQIPNSIYRYNDQKFNKAKLLLYLNGTYVDRDRYILHDNMIYLVDDEIEINNDHRFTMVYLDVVDNEEIGLETNIVERTYEEGLDDIIFEVRLAKPVSLTFG